MRLLLRTLVVADLLHGWSTHRSGGRSGGDQVTYPHIHAHPHPYGQVVEAAA